MTAPTRRGTTNQDVRGNTEDRYRRKLFLLKKFGNGKTAACRLRTSPKCLGQVDINTVTVDRIVPGCQGGGYRRDNIQPACGPCNCNHGGGIRGTQ